MNHRKRPITGLSLWALVETLQKRFEDRGLGPDDVDAAVIGRLGTLMSRPSKNDQRVGGLVPLIPSPVEA